MRFEWRRLRSGELDHELIWLLVTVGAAAFGALWFWLQLPWPRCGWRALTGLSCATCGATRAAQAFLQGDFLGALRFNPLIAIGFCGVVLYDLYASAVLLTGAPRLRVKSGGRQTRAVAFLLLVLLGGLNWIYLLRE